MKKYVFVLFFNFIFINNSISQIFSIKDIDNSPSITYLKILDSIKLNKIPSLKLWNELFQNPIVLMLIQGSAIDSGKIKHRLIHLQDNNQGDEISKYIIETISEIEQLKKYAENFKSKAYFDSVYRLLKDYVPIRLHNKFYESKQFLLPLFQESTGFNGFVLNDLLFSFKADQKKCGIITAHETFHSIVSSAFQKKIKPDSDYNSYNFYLLSFLQNISEEGIADRIDKTILGEVGSPLEKTVNSLLLNSDSISAELIIKLDSYLSNLFLEKKDNFKNYNDLVKDFGKNGGHMPGRYMEKIIEKADLLNLVIEKVEDPVNFFLVYNLASKKIGSAPSFKNTSEQFLKDLRNKFLEQ